MSGSKTGAETLCWGRLWHPATDFIDCMCELELMVPRDSLRMPHVYVPPDCVCSFCAHFQPVAPTNVRAMVQIFDSLNSRIDEVHKILRPKK